jgi:hypothetical protein
MCFSVYDCHLCGQHGSEIEYKKCGYRRDAAEILASVYSSNVPFRTREDNGRLYILGKACAEIFQVWDDIRIVPNCEACAAEVWRLREVEAAKRCGRKMREKRGEEKNRQFVA